MRWRIGVGVSTFHRRRKTPSQGLENRFAKPEVLANHVHPRSKSTDRKGRYTGAQSVSVQHGPTPVNPGRNNRLGNVPGSSSADSRSSRVRSALTNHREVLPNVDGRSASARRFRDIVTCNCLRSGRFRVHGRGAIAIDQALCRACGACRGR